MLLAELTVRHTRRHMPTRRVALGDRVLPTGHPGYGPILLACVAATTIDGLDEEQAESLLPFLREARNGLSVPRRALFGALRLSFGLDNGPADVDTLLKVIPTLVEAAKRAPALT